ncbi:hypothetical protein WMY93_033425 [Mugilogobius chulae]|uniref:Uncharacterized protein n=1 Tax=Mugilogobius chulae TaxID=88201 RepID=A0AAW0MTX3_9GOBI
MNLQSQSQHCIVTNRISVSGAVPNVRRTSHSGDVVPRTLRRHTTAFFKYTLETQTVPHRCEPRISGSGAVPKVRKTSQTGDVRTLPLMSSVCTALLYRITSTFSSLSVSVWQEGYAARSGRAALGSGSGPESAYR